MADEPAIVLDGISKMYHKRAGTGTLLSMIPGFRPRESDEFWALKDVSFEVKRGECLGIIGPNGAGKSTILKILSRITSPTSGTYRVNGRLSSLIEVGAGFHPELTGRENVYLNAAILGMSKKETAAKFDEIVEFAELGDFIDVPIKRYSSGMYVRLGFAVAAHLITDILLVDEVLSVGDASFRSKCLGKMDDVAKAGRTVLFISHNMAAVNLLCMKCIWIDQGTVHQIGRTEQVVHAYLNCPGTERFSGEANLANWRNRYGSGEARILSARLLDDDGRVTAAVQRTRPMQVEFVVESQAAHELHFSAVVVGDLGAKVLHMSHHDTPGFEPGVLLGRYRVRFRIPQLPLCAGNYSLTLGIHTNSLAPLDVVSDVLPFVAEDIVDSPRPYETVSEHAYCWTPNDWSIEPLAE